MNLRPDSTNWAGNLLKLTAPLCTYQPNDLSSILRFEQKVEGRKGGLARMVIMITVVTITVDEDMCQVLLSCSINGLGSMLGYTRMPVLHTKAKGLKIYMCMSGSGEN